MRMTYRVPCRGNSLREKKQDANAGVSDINNIEISSEPHTSSSEVSKYGEQQANPRECKDGVLKS